MYADGRFLTDSIKGGYPYGKTHGKSYTGYRPCCRY